MFLTNEACWVGVVVGHSNDRIGQGDRDGRKYDEVEAADEVEKLVLREEVHQLVVQEHLSISPGSFMHAVTKPLKKKCDRYIVTTMKPLQNHKKQEPCDRYNTIIMGP